MRFLGLLVDLHVAVNNTKPLSAAIEPHCCQARKHFVLLRTIPMYRVILSLEVKISPVTGLNRPRGFQEVKVSRFHDNGIGWW